MCKVICMSNPTVVLRLGWGWGFDNKIEIFEKRNKSHKMKSDGNDIFDTPRLRYYKLRKEFYRKYLNPKAWDHEFDSKEIVQAYHDLLQFLEKTEAFRDLTKSLN